jgi:hypothetical protein
MLVPNHHTDGFVTLQSLSLVGEAWMTEVVPCLPANLAEQARVLKAVQRVCGIATPHDLLRLWRKFLKIEILRTPSP